ncbi:pre-peptidase C-terminal domain-containing protein [Fulvimonas soli]|jgi:xanthomonalisin|uniref:Xanthomonalisin n=1 Tax=Fulvimonas soli TaxID=155197 RepID=A0A316I2Z6_9GAMM|nr:pre-peptidase C-terminal domain-containing protein [Fulvimonas soli]PWK87528.1 xanthomonalisin [Fulvimonas soli]TNY26214.1 xanthorhodopsin [Fulvimonas soli]
MQNKFLVLRRSLLAAAVGLTLASAAASATDASTLAATDTSPVAAHAVALRKNESYTGQLPFSQPMHVEIALKLRNGDELKSFIAAARQGYAPLAQRYMSREQFLQRHAPTADQAQAVANFLSRAGFTNVTISDNRMLVSGDATADVAQAAFHTSFAKVRSHDGRDTYANTSDAHIPAALQDSVLSVIGLQDVHRAHTFARVAKRDALTPQAVTGHNPTEFAAIYGGAGAPTGAGVKVGIITQGKLTQVVTDLNKFTSNNGLATVTTTTVNTNGTSSDTSGLGEWDLDSQDIVGMAGGQVGGLIFYNIPTLSNSNLTADINKVVSDNQVKIINVSLGECETDAKSDGSAAAQDQAFQQAVAQGQTFSISTGDDGADECGDGGTTPSWPAASQYVVAVAGTKLDASTTTWNSEVVWNELSNDEGATGGSESTFEPKPSWQTLWTGSHRGVADVAFDGDPESGAKVIVNGSTEQIGGTSLSAPLFSGFWARVLAAKGTDVGFAGPLIYQLPASDFHDITSGNNDGESASAGYDLASGRGSIIMASAINDIGGGGGGGTNNPPVANFGVTTSGLTASFTDSSTDSDGSIVSRSWSFGDGGTSTATNPSHTYAAAGTYTVSLTVTDDDGATNTKTQSVTVSSGGGGGGGSLQNGVPVTNQSGSKGQQLSYTAVVPSGASNLVISISGGSGDADLYVKYGSAPTLTSYDCRPYKTGNSESCTFAAPQAGTYYVMINGYAAFSGVSVQASWSTGGGGGGGNVLQNGVPVTGLSASTGNSVTYTMNVPAGESSLSFAISGGTGDADLYVKRGSAPTTSSYDCRPYKTGNNETCTFSSPQSGTYYVTVRAYQTYSGVSLTGSYH